MALKAFLVEDSPGIREALAETLAELAGIETTGWAASQKAAVAWLRDPANHWDIAVVDLILEPGGSGLGVLLAVQQRQPHQKVVVLTATASPQVREQCLRLGCDGFFDKAIEADALIAWCAALSASAAAVQPPPQAA